MTETATYLYCLLRHPAPPKLKGAPAGLPYADAVRALAADDGLWLIAAPVPLAHYGEAAIEKGLQDLSWVSSCALAHEAVVEFAGKLGPVLPMKLFTLFLDESRAAAHIRGQRKRIDRLLDKVAGRAEWGVRVSLDELKARKSAAERARAAAGPGAGGTAFLLRKKAEQDLSRQLLDDARQEMDRAFDELAERADDARRKAPAAAEGGRRQLLDAAFLVPEGDTGPFQQAVRALAARLAESGYDLTLTGPWPPYNFIGEAR